MILARYVAHCLLRKLPSILAGKCDLPKAPHYISKGSLTYYTILKLGILGSILCPHTLNVTYCSSIYYVTKDNKVNIHPFPISLKLCFLQVNTYCFSSTVYMHHSTHKKFSYRLNIDNSVATFPSKKVSKSTNRSSFSISLKFLTGSQSI